MVSRKMASEGDEVGIFPMSAFTPQTITEDGSRSFLTENR